MIVKTTCCEDCPIGYLDMEDGYYCGSTGTPQNRKENEFIPKDCPLLIEEITIKLI